MTLRKKKIIVILTALISLGALAIVFLKPKHVITKQTIRQGNVLNVSDSATHKAALSKVNSTASSVYSDNQITVVNSTNTVLPDSTNRYKIWIAPASTLFCQSDSICELRGQAYFEVKNRNEKLLTIVVKNDLHKLCIISIVSGNINISAYPNDSLVSTTLVKGQAYIDFSDKWGRRMEKLPIGQKTLLRIEADDKTYGQRITDNSVSTDIDIASSIKKGIYEFNNEPIEPIMRMCSRIYKVKVVYQAKKDVVFTGKIAFNAKLSKFLKILEAKASLHFKFEQDDSTVYVMRPTR